MPIRPVYIGFIGFDSTEIKSATFIKYKNDDSTFMNALDSITCSHLNLKSLGDTLYENEDTIMHLIVESGYKYSLSFQNPVRTYVITSKLYEEKKVCIIMEKQCSSGSYQADVQPLQDVAINGQITTLADDPEGKAFFLYHIYVKK